MIEKTNKDCKLIGTEVCEFAGSEGCERCYLSGINLKTIEEGKVNDNWLVTTSYLPDNVDDLHTAETCWLCKKEDKNKAECFAVIDLAHPEPEHKKGIFFGLGKKVRTSIGSLVQIPVCACKECRRRYRMRELILWGSLLLGLLVAILVVAIPSVESALAQVGWYLPLLVFAAVIGVFALAGYLCQRAYNNKASARTEFNLFNLPILSEMKWRGWFSIQGTGVDVPRVIFTNKKPRPNMRFKPKKCGQSEQNSVDSPNDSVIE